MNSIQHTQSGSITVSMGCNANKMVEVIVEDTGKGIKQSEQIRLRKVFNSNTT